MSSIAAMAAMFAASRDEPVAFEDAPEPKRMRVMGIAPTLITAPPHRFANALACEVLPPELLDMVGQYLCDRGDSFRTHQKAKIGELCLCSSCNGRLVTKNVMLVYQESLGGNYTSDYVYEMCDDCEAKYGGPDRRPACTWNPVEAEPDVAMADEKLEKLIQEFLRDDQAAEQELLALPAPKYSAPPVPGPDLNGIIDLTGPYITIGNLIIIDD